MSEAITIMHLRATNFVGGPEKQILEHFASVDRECFSMLLGTFIDEGQEDSLGDAARSRGFSTVRMPVLSPFDPRSFSMLARELRRNRVDILCTHGYKPDLLGLVAGRLAGVRVVSISRGWTWENAKVRLFEGMDRRALRYMDHVVAVSEGQREKVMAQKVAPERVSVIRNAIVVDGETVTPVDIRDQLGLPADAVIVASAGRLSPEKNYGGMIAVAGLVAPQHPSLFFVVFGEGALRPVLERQIAEARLSDRFLLPGFRADLPGIMNEIDVFMLPSFTEGLPNVVLEAFAARKPVLATRVGGTPEVVQEGISGFLTAPEEHRLMAYHLETLLGDPHLQARMGEAGYRQVRNTFGFQAQTAAYEALYRRLYREAPGAAPLGGA